MARVREGSHWLEHPQLPANGNVKLCERKLWLAILCTTSTGCSIGNSLNENTAPPKYFTWDQMWLDGQLYWSVRLEQSRCCSTTDIRTYQLVAHYPLILPPWRGEMAYMQCLHIVILLHDLGPRNFPPPQIICIKSMLILNTPCSTFFVLYVLYSYLCMLYASYCWSIACLSASEHIFE